MKLFLSLWGNSNSDIFFYMKASQKALAVLVMLAFIVPNLYFIIKGKEDFPFTQAPMFAHYIGDSTMFYDFKFIGQNGDVEKIVYPSMKQAREDYDLPTIRLFFSKVYGSVEKKSPFGYIENDTREKMEERMSRFFAAYFKFLESDTSDIDTIRFEISQYDRKYNFKEKHVIGYYDVNTKNFTSTWRNEN